MSVPEGEREDGKFTLPIKAEYLARYTIEITANENVFLPKYREAITNDIINSAKNCYLAIRDANDVTVRIGTVYQRSDWRDRNKLQKEALRNARSLIYLIDIAHRLFHLSSKRVRYWGNMTREVRNRIQGWIIDDTARYAT